MEYSNSTFRTLHDVRFEKGKYLYHYSGLDKAQRIIYYDNLRFSGIDNLNDTTESKNKIWFKEYSLINDIILDFFQETINRHIRICCFSQDNLSYTTFTKSDNRYFTDRSGRGFALPRMWSQYGADNKGVCFIFNKEKLRATIEKKGVYMIEAPVNYVMHYPSFEITSDITDYFTQNIIKKGNKDTDWVQEFFRRYPECIINNYFVKREDWKNEYEYRYVVYVPDKEDVFEIGPMSSFLEGIVVGENIDEVDITILKKLINIDVPIRRIVFQQKETVLM